MKKMVFWKTRAKGQYRLRASLDLRLVTVDANDPNRTLETFEKWVTSREEAGGRGRGGGGRQNKSPHSLPMKLVPTYFFAHPP